VTDTIQPLLDRLLVHADPGFVPPAFEAALAESVLGASGGLRTPHRRLLECMNGGYFFERSLHVFGACADPPWHSLGAWNSPALWRDAYGEAAEGLVCFAEDAFGDQYAYSGRGGEVVCFEAELGRVVSVAPHFVAWLEGLLEQPEAVLPLDVMRREVETRQPLEPGWQLFAYPPLCTVESRQGVTVGQVDAVEAMRFRGSLALQLRNLPPGARVAIEIE
jgi:SMI1/KNR4 family protein SUKH-1